jgi:hypothetical protein
MMNIPRQSPAQIWGAKSGIYKAGLRRVPHGFANFTTHRSRRAAPNAPI